MNLYIGLGWVDYNLQWCSESNSSIQWSISCQHFCGLRKYCFIAHLTPKGLPSELMSSTDVCLILSTHVNNYTSFSPHARVTLYVLLVYSLQLVVAIFINPNLSKIKMSFNWLKQGFYLTEWFTLLRN
jgi:hypothetical protein